MNSTPLFSILIANYNNGNYIADAINSIYRQTYNHWEIVIVDDCSTDNSIEILKKYEEDLRFHIYYNDINYGCGYTKRRCAELAKGDILGFLDPDDTLEPNALEVMVSAHKRDDTLSMVYSRHNIVDENLNIISVSTQQRRIPEGSSFLEGEGGISHFVSFKSSSYKKTPGIDVNFLRAVDHDMYFMLEEVGKVEFVDKVLYNYRINTGNNISLGNNIDKAFLWHIVGMIDACRRRNLSIEDIVFTELQKWGKYKADTMIRESISYRIGSIILTPLKLLRRIFHKV